MRLSICLCALALLASLAASAQPQQVRVEVVDPAGNPTEGARVVLTSESGSPSTASRTSAAGVATLEVTPGLYRVEVNATGFEIYRQDNLRVGGDVVTVRVELELEPLATTIQIVESAPAPIRIERIGADRLRISSPMDLVEKLHEFPGVLGVRRGATNLDPVVHGLRENQLAMVVDSAQTFAAGPGRMDSGLSFVAAGFVGEVAVIKGPYALTEGSGAMSAILVQTSPIPYYTDWTFGGDLGVGYGFNDSGRFASASVYGANRKFGFRLRGVGDKSNHYEAGSLGDRPQWVPGRHSHHQFGGKLRFQIADSQELLFDGGYDEQTNVDYPGRLLNAVHFLSRNWAGSYQYNQPTPLVQAVKFGLYLNKKSHRMTNDNKPTAMDMPARVPPFALGISIPVESDTWGGSGSVSMTPTPMWTFRTGFDFYSLDQDAQRFIARRSNGAVLFSDSPWPEVHLADQGFYAQATRAFEKGELSGTLRFDLVQGDVDRPSDFYLENTTGDVNRNEFNTSFSLAGRRNLAGGLTLGGGFGRVVRTANALERYSDRFPSTKFQVAAEFMGAPGMRPEVSYQGDLSLEYRLDRLTLDAGAFYRRIDDYITVAPDPGLPPLLPLSPRVVYRYVNGDRATFRGFDFGFRWDVRSGLELRSQGAYTLGDDKEENLTEVGINEPVLGMPPLEIRSSLRYVARGDRLWGEFSMRNVWNQDRVAWSRLETPSPGFTTFDLRFGANLPRRITLLVALDNLTNKYYFEHINSLNPFTRQHVPERGRNLYVALNKSW